MEGGYFRRSYTASHSTTLVSGAASGAERPLLSSIYYLLTDDSPIGVFHCNRSDIVHYWQRGSSLRYFLIDPQGSLSQVVLGPDLAAGEQLQLTVPGGYWKATRLEQGEFGLLSEAVAPGFDYDDMQLATATQLAAAFPELWQQHSALLTELCSQP